MKFIFIHFKKSHNNLLSNVITDMSYFNSDLGHISMMLLYSISYVPSTTWDKAEENILQYVQIAQKMK